jgi:hypothetical protein
MNYRWSDLAKRIDAVCDRLNNGLMAVTIVLAALAFLMAVHRSAEVGRVPEGFAIVATT